MKLSLYIARRFLRATFMVVGAFFVILYVIEILEQLRRFGGNGVGFGEAAFLAALVVPERIYTVLPILMMLSGVVLFIGLARSSELVVIRAAGRSALTMLIAPVVTTILLGAAAVAVGNPILAASAQRYEDLAAQYRAGALTGGSDTRISIGSEGLWLRQGATLTGAEADAALEAAALISSEAEAQDNPDADTGTQAVQDDLASTVLGALSEALAETGAALGAPSRFFREDGSVDLNIDPAQNALTVTPPTLSAEAAARAAALATSQVVIHAARANLDATTLYETTFLVFSADAGPARRIEAREAILSDGYWTLRDVKDWPLKGSTNPERDATTRAVMRLPSDLTPERIRDGFGTPQAIAIWDLPDYIQELERAGFSAQRHRVWFQMELALPFVLATMVLIAAGFTMRHVRFGGTGRMVMLALFAGLGMFFLRNVAQVLGENGQISVFLAAWAPPMIAGMLALTLLLHLEDG
ncbi:LptF/LptG family permease [Albirhodobacter sp. R86504]|uniref:LptF/LptG family permease n=1 Tax=Albirhodobacter sp. R86504 TaxID=3093848 RepID=UPI00366DC392